MLANSGAAGAAPASPTRPVAPEGPLGWRERTLIAGLRRKIRAIERLPLEAGRAQRVFSCGAAAIDETLPWGGLPRAAVHEVVERDAGVGTGFAAVLLAHLIAPPAGAEARRVLWCLGPRSLYQAGNLFAPGLAAFGFSPDRLILARGRSEGDVLWAMEEGLRCPLLAAVVGEVHAIDLVASRRLQLAAEASGVTGFVVCPQDARLAPTAAVTRWRVAAAPSAGAAPGATPGQAIGTAWQVELVRCRSGAPGAWSMAWHRSSEHESDGNTDDAAGGFAVVAELRDGPVEPQRSVRVIA